jgi:hypothetical protein
MIEEMNGGELQPWAIERENSDVLTLFSLQDYGKRGENKNFFGKWVAGSTNRYCTVEKMVALLHL